MTRQRAKTTHSYGSMKKNRGYGNKGGHGNAGSGKRGDCKKPSYWGIKRYFGKYGFTPVQVKNVVVCNIQQLEEQHQKLLKSGVCKEEKGVLSINLGSIGIDKLLSKGTPSKRWSIMVTYASASAIDKIKKQEGSVTVASNKEAVKQPKEELATQTA
jgi:large subunit ribosomal protein L15